MRKNVPLAERLQAAGQKLDTALLSNDPIMAALMVDVEGAEVRPRTLSGSGVEKMPEITCIEGEFAGRENWSGICEARGKLYCAPRNNESLPT